MRRLSHSWPWVALVAAALAVGLASGVGAGDDFPVPSVANAGPKGAGSSTPGTPRAAGGWRRSPRR
ncbi:MAG: hypothetical protein H6Q89_3685, partial [Myxococcaceae bacterium]|nr:hypothetical protein [Myxococcaceae bacterium]